MPSADACIEHTHTHTHTAIDGEDELVRNYVDISVAVATPEG